MKKKTLGYAFKDEVAKVAVKAGHFSQKSENDWKDSFLPNFRPNFRSGLESSFWRVTLFFSLILVGFFILFLRLFYLQILQGAHNLELADGNRILIKVIHAPRGIIYDRNGKILASNSPGFRLLDPNSKKITYLTREDALAMEVNNDPRYNNLEVDSIRHYPMGAELAHVVGYLGEVSPEQLLNQQYRNYKAGDRIGESGIEAYYESTLRGTDGGEIIEVDAQGRKVRTIRTVEPIPGQNVYTTIDSDLQHQVYVNLVKAIQTAKSCCGAAIAMDPNNGQVLALVSYPSFDPNIFTDTQKSDLIGSVLLEPDSPVLNRAIGGTYPPGSTYKIISSIAALESGKITPETEFDDTGITSIGPYTFANWYFGQYGRKEGEVNLVKALQRSNDTYYYMVSEQIGEQALIDWSRKIDLGKPLGIDLNGEVSGLVPDHAWKLKNTGQPWYPGDTLHMAIGQGYDLTTPLQVLGYTSFIAANGTLYKPQLFLKSTNDDDSVVKQFKPQTLVSNIVDPANISLIQTGLKLVPQSGGTAWPFFNFPIPTAGKTGTAEYGDPKDRTHAWYTSYAPADNPKIAMTVLVEGGGEGSNVSAPVVKEVYRWYFSPDKNNLIKDVNQVATSSAKLEGE